jgi:KUP system potassium uptake protein
MIMEMVAMISVAIIVILFSVHRCFTWVTVTHSSSKHEGQVYILEINYILMLACIIVAASFKDTTKIGNTYGMAMVGVMIVTSSFLTLVMLMIWQTHLLLVVIFVTVFGAIEFTYFLVVLYKFPKGGYLPLAFATVLLFVMYVWNYVHRNAYEVEQKVSSEYVLSLGSSLDVTKVPRIGLLYSELAQGVPTIFAHFIRNLPAMHSVLVFICVRYLPVNIVAAGERLTYFDRQNPSAPSYTLRTIMINHCPII